jgi:hypothetical protein
MIIIIIINYYQIYIYIAKKHETKYEAFMSWQHWWWLVANQQEQK